MVGGGCGRLRLNGWKVEFVVIGGGFGCGRWRCGAGRGRLKGW